MPYAITNLVATTPPQASPPPQNKPPTPPPTPQMVVEVTPQPNATKPTPVKIKVIIKYPNIDISRYDIFYMIVNVDNEQNPQPGPSGYLQLQKISDDEAIAELKVSGEHRYDIYIDVLFEGSDIESVIVHNYKPQKIIP